MSEVAPPKSHSSNFSPDDILSSVVVFLVALPLSMGVAIASGAPPAAGLITGVIGGLIVGFLAGSPLQVSGPAAGLSVIVWDLISKHGLEGLAVIVLLGGTLQLIAGLFKLGQWFRAVSPAVIQGMLAGIGVLIFAGQFHVMVDDGPRENGVKNLAAIPESISKVLSGEAPAHRYAAVIGVVSLLVLALWKTLAPKKIKIVPAALVAVVAASVIAGVLQWPIAFAKVPDSLLDSIRLPTVDTLALLMKKEILIAAFVLAAIASAETLLCATAVDQLHNGPRTNYDRELAAQGFGNMLCGAVGGLPMTGVIVRSAANVEAGAKTRASTILHGAWILVAVGLLPFVLRLIPVSGLAAILVFTGWKLIGLKGAVQLCKRSPSEALIYAATVVGITTTDLLTGVLIGIGLSAAKLLYRFSHLSIRVEASAGEPRTTLHLEGSATFLRLPKLAAVLDALPQGTELHLRMDHLDYIDHACMDLLSGWEKRQSAAGGKLVVDWDAAHVLSNPVPAQRSAAGVSVYG